MKYPDDFVNKVINGDCIEVMKNIPDNCIDTIITDPPYFLTNDSSSGFMGLTWDSINDIMKLIWLNKDFVNFAEKFFMPIHPEAVGEEEFIVQGSVNTKELVAKEEKLEDVSYVKSLLKLQNRLKRDFAQAIVITKQELLELLKEWCGNLIKNDLFPNGDKENVLFVIPISLLKREIKNSALGGVMRKIKVKKCKERIIHLTLMEGLKINDALEEVTGNKSEKLSINEIITLVNYAEKNVKEKKFSVIISENIERHEKIPYLTSLLCALFAIKKQKTIPNLLVENFNYQWAKECLRVAKPGATLLCFGGTRTFHRLACGLEDAGFVIKDTLMWVYGCLSEDTEILTINGWEHYHKDIDKYPVLCYNVNNDNFEFHKPTRKFLYENEYPAYRIKSDFTDQIVSRNHRILIEREGKFIFQRAETLQPEENIPILESLQDLPETIYDFQSHTGIKKSDLLKRVSQNSNTKKQEEEAITRKKDEKNKMSDLWQRFLASFGLDKKEQQPLLFKTLCGKSKRLVKEDRIFRQKKLDRKEFRKLSPKNDWGKQPVLERWSNLFQKTRELFANKICQMSKRIFNYGSERWLCYGTSAYNSTKIGQTIIKNGSGSSYQSQFSRQQNRESYIISKQQRTQTIRSTRAKIEEIEYKGNVWCVEVPTGAFVARRNGKIFITGNSGFPKSLNIALQFEQELCERKDNKWVYRDTGEEMRRKPPFRNEQANLWIGYGTALKPAFEPIIWAIKPNDKNFVNNALKWGVAGLNINEARIGIEKIQAHHAPKGTFAGGEPDRGSDTNYYTNQGRFPANLVISCDCDYKLKSGITEEQKKKLMNWLYENT